VREREFVPICYGEYNELLKDHPGLPMWPISCSECKFLSKCKSMTELKKNPNLLYENYIYAPKIQDGVKLLYNVIIANEDECDE